MSLSYFFIRSQTFGEVSFSEIIPESLHSFLIPGAFPILAETPSGYLLFQEIKGNDFLLWHHTILLNQDDRFSIACETPVLSLNFCLENSFFLCRRGRPEELAFHEGQYNMNFSPSLDLEGEFLKGRVYRFLTIFYSPEWLGRISIPYPPMASFLEKADLNEEDFLFPSNQTTNSELKKLIDELVFSDCKEELTKSCIRKGKASEILIQVLEQTMKETPLAGPWLSKKDTEKIYAARDFLDQLYDRPFTLFELARKVGMNVHKLSSGFLQITGSTVFCYHRNVRMSKAVQLLEETERSLFDIGTEVGYMDGKSFSKEFKKDKGMTPFEWRRRLRTMRKGA